MKKIVTRTALAALIGAGTVGSAQAQSSVTLYGIIDAGITWFSNLNGHSTFVANDGSIQSNRWGLRGVEDLGGGTRAVFDLENGFNLYSGTMVQSGVLFSRQAWVGLSNNAAGTLTLGKQYDFFWDDLTQFAMGQFAGQYSWHPGDFDHLAGTLHINNAVKYTSPNIAGLTFGGLYAFPSQSVSAGTGRVYALGARYTNGPLNLGIAYTNTHDLGLNGPSQAGTTFFPSLPAGPVLASNVASLGAGGSYRYGRSLSRLLFTDTRFKIGGNSGSMLTYEANEAFFATPATTLMAGAWYSKLGSQKWVNATMLCDYALSKSADIYTSATWLRATGGAAPVFLGGGAAPVFVNGLYAGTGATSVAVRVGLRKLF